jgi:hypothetical protein
MVLAQVRARQTEATAANFGSAAAVRREFGRDPARRSDGAVI